MAHRMQQPDIRHYLALLAILLIAIWLRFWRIESLPPGFHFDESFEGLEALRMLQDASYRPVFLLGNFGVPPVNSYLNAVTFRLFMLAGAEPGPVAMHVTAATMGSLTIFLIYKLGWELQWLAPQLLTPLFPLWAAASLALMRWHIHFSRMGIEPILVPLLWCATCWLFLRGWRTKQISSFAASGTLLATAMYTYQGAWVIPLLFVPLMLHLMLHQWRTASALPATSGWWAAVWPDNARSRGVATAALVAAVLVLPLLWFFYQNPTMLMLRPNQLAIVGQTGSPADASFLHNLRATVSMFGPFGAPGDLDPRRNIPGMSALNLWLAAPFYIGTFYAVRWLLHPAFGLLLLGLVGLVAPGLFSEYAPHFHRILGAAAPTALLCGLGLDSLSRLKWTGQPQRSNTVATAICVALLLLGGFTSGWNYFKRWAQMPELFYAFDVGFWELGRWISQQPADTTIFITPRGADHPTIQFALQATGTRHGDAPLSFDGRHIFPYTASPEQSEYYISIVHEDFRTPLLLPGIFPEAAVVHTILDDAGKPYVEIYKRASESLAQRLPQHALNATLGDGIQLFGYDLQPEQLAAGQMLYLQLYWQTLQAPEQDWTVFTHLLSVQPDGAVTQVAGNDSRPGRASLPTTQWQAGWRVLDEVQILLPDDLAAGEYRIDAGMYQLANDEFLQLGEAVELGTIYISAQ